MGNSLEHHSTKMVEIAQEATETLAQITCDSGTRTNQSIRACASMEKGYIGLPGGGIGRSSQILYSLPVSNSIYHTRLTISNQLQGASKIQCWWDLRTSTRGRTEKIWGWWKSSHWLPWHVKCSEGMESSSWAINVIMNQNTFVNYRWSSSKSWQRGEWKLMCFTRGSEATRRQRLSLKGLMEDVHSSTTWWRNTTVRVANWGRQT